MAASDDLDLRGLDAQGARRYVLAFVTTLKESQRRLKSLEAELRTWSDRAALARSKGREDLASAADAKAASLGPRLAEARAEEADLLGKVSVLKEKLKLKLHGEIERSVDSERLEAELEMLTGEDSAAAAPEPGENKPQG
jgi:phage shock protein A